MAITNVTKPTTSFTNASRAAGYETWATIDATWATETRSWLDMGTIFSNVAKAVGSEFLLLESGFRLLLETGNKIKLESSGVGITNVAKP